MLSSEGHRQRRQLPATRISAAQSAPNSARMTHTMIGMRTAIVLLIHFPGGQGTVDHKCCVIVRSRRGEAVDAAQFAAQFVAHLAPANDTTLDCGRMVAHPLSRAHDLDHVCRCFAYFRMIGRTKVTESTAANNQLTTLIGGLPVPTDLSALA